MQQQKKEEKKRVANLRLEEMPVAMMWDENVRWSGAVVVAVTAVAASGMSRKLFIKISEQRFSQGEVNSNLLYTYLHITSYTCVHLRLGGVGDTSIGQPAVLRVFLCVIIMQCGSTKYYMPFQLLHIFFISFLYPFLLWYLGNRDTFFQMISI